MCATCSPGHSPVSRRRRRSRTSSTNSARSVRRHGARRCTRCPRAGRDRRGQAITRELLTDADDEVARSAWRAAVVLVPEGEEPELAGALATQLGRGGRETRLSLSRALVALGEVAMPTLRAAMTDHDPGVRQHAIATERLLRNPDAGFEWAIEEAKRIVALGTTGQEE